MNQPQHEQRSYDVVIVGGGIVGLTLANALVDTDFSVAVIERAVAAPTPESKQTDLRVSAINQVASTYFKSLQLWPHLQQRYCAFQQMQVWDTTGLGQIHFDSAELGLPELGHIIENSVLVRALLASVEAAENIQLYCPVSIKNISLVDDGGDQACANRTVVTLQDGYSLNASLLVGADGARSQVREIAGIEFISHRYQQQGLVCAVETENSHQQTAWQCFLPSGPLAFLPLFNGQSSIVWSLDEGRANEMLALNDNDFKQALAQASEYRLGEIKAVSERKLFPLAHGHANDYVKLGLALIGDAAHIIHPLAGQGANLGIADAICLAGVIKQAKASNRQWYAVHTLLKYQRQRKIENRLMENAMTGFKTLFGQTSPVLVELRNAGLSLVDHLPALKNMFIRRALGG